MKFAIKQKPNYGDKRTIERFAWFPTEVWADDSYQIKIKVWLEFYTIRQEWEFEYSYFWNMNKRFWADRRDTATAINWVYM